jgi:hypothetical protein
VALVDLHARQRAAGRLLAKIELIISSFRSGQGRLVQTTVDLSASLNLLDQLYSQIQVQSLEIAMLRAELKLQT